jgi:hypothetical protein
MYRFEIIEQTIKWLRTSPRMALLGIGAPGLLAAGFLMLLLVAALG